MCRVVEVAAAVVLAAAAALSCGCSFRGPVTAPDFEQPNMTYVFVCACLREGRQEQRAVYEGV